MRKSKSFSVAARNVPQGVVVEGPDVSIRIDCDDLVPIPDPSANFAVWLTLPLAMRQGRDLHVAGTVCPILARNAERVSEIWETWKPELFSRIRINADKFGSTPPSQGTGHLMTYSGGLDSTYALSRHVETTGERPDVLTVLGMDYRAGDREKFDRLLARTAAFRRERTGQQIIARSDAASVMRRYGVSADLGFAFQLLGLMYLFEHRYSRGMMAADFAAFQELITGPYGTSATLAPYWASAGFGVDLLGLDVTKSEKVSYILDDALSLETVSFCKDYASRPDNCGVCAKCTRTKAIMYALRGTVPDIFLKGAFDPALLSSFDLTRPYERMFAQDILRIARGSGL